MFVREGVNFGGKELSIETGRMAKQADGSVVVRYGDTMVLVTAVASSACGPGVDFMPLTVDYLEKTSAAGRIPGGYFKREGRMTEVEVLTSRLIDRPSRPLFPKGWRFDTQVIAMVVSTDRENASDVLAMTGASTALHLSDIPVGGPVRRRPRRPRRRQVGRQPDLRRARDVRPRPDRRRQPRRDRHGRGRLRRGQRGRHRRRADVRAQGGPAADRPAGEAAGGGRQAEARVRAAGQGSGDRRARWRRSPTRRSRRRWPSATSTSATRRSTRRAAETKAALAEDVPGSRRRGRRCVRVGQEEAPARAGAEHRQAHRRPRADATSARSPARRACCRGRTARRCSRAARRRRWSPPRSAPARTRSTSRR